MLIQHAYRLGILAAAAVLAGCGNAVEHLSLGEWQEVGLREPPLATSGSFLVTTTVPGEGTVVSAGDLVKARVVVTTVDMFGRTKYNPDTCASRRDPFTTSTHAILRCWQTGGRVMRAYVPRRNIRRSGVCLGNGSLRRPAQG
jgi:hypothetical protein